MKIGISGIPGLVGGAATKIIDMIRLLHAAVDLVVIVPNGKVQLESAVQRVLSPCRWRMITRHEAEKETFDAVIGVCQLDIFTSGFARRLKERGTKFLWSNDMMWEFQGEADAVKEGLIDGVIFVSDVQREAFSGLYKHVKQFLVPNYISPSDFPFADRSNTVFTIGRLSRPDPVKYPADFPVFYESLGLDDVRFRVQAWSPALAKLYAWHRFGPQWELLSANKIPACKFLQSLDLFVYPLGHGVVESWGRSTAEAMLTGCVPLVPAGHFFHRLMEPGESGFIFESFDDCRECARLLYRDARARKRMSLAAARYAREHLFNEENHRALWLTALASVLN